MDSSVVKTKQYILYLTHEEHAWLMEKLQEVSKLPSSNAQIILHKCQNSAMLELSENHAAWLKGFVQNPLSDGDGSKDFEMRKRFWTALGGSIPIPSPVLHGTASRTVRPPVGMANEDIPF